MSRQQRGRQARQESQESRREMRARAAEVRQRDAQLAAANRETKEEREQRERDEFIAEHMRDWENNGGAERQRGPSHDTAEPRVPRSVLPRTAWQIPEPVSPSEEHRRRREACAAAAQKRKSDEMQDPLATPGSPLNKRRPLKERRMSQPTKMDLAIEDTQRDWEMKLGGADVLAGSLENMRIDDQGSESQAAAATSPADVAERKLNILSLVWTRSRWGGLTVERDPQTRKFIHVAN